MRKLHFWLISGIIIALLGWLLAESLAVGIEAGRSVPIFSVYRYDPLGMAAFDHYLEKSGIQVKVLQHPAFQMQYAGVFIDINPPGNFVPLLESATLTKHYHPRLMRWVRRGNTLFEVTYEPTDLTEHEHLQVRPSSAPPIVKTSPPAHKPPRTATTHPFAPPAKPPSKLGKARMKAKHHRSGAVHYSNQFYREDVSYWTHRNPRWFESAMTAVRWKKRSETTTSTRHRSARSTVWLAMPSQFIPLNKKVKSRWQPLLTWHGRVLAAQRRLGKGRIVLLGSPWPLLNGGIAEGGNLDFLMSIIGRRPVIFNEYGLGIGGGMTTLELFRRFGLAALGLQLLVLLVAVLWNARRFSRQRVPSDRELVASNIEQIAMLGRLYQQSMSRDEIAAGVAAEVYRRIGASLKVKRADIPAALNRLSPDLREKVTRLLADADTIARLAEMPSGARNRPGVPSAAQLLTQSVRLCEEIKRDRK